MTIWQRALECIYISHKIYIIRALVQYLYGYIYYTNALCRHSSDDFYTFRTTVRSAPYPKRMYYILYEKL